jgi:putative FmdB family regulatory protein
MPIYEYACKACGHEFEEWQKISDKPIRTCPSCKKRKVEKLVSMSSFQLKGGGWYADGYASSKGKGDEAKTSGPKADSDSKSSDSKSSDSKAKDSKSKSKDKGSSTGSGSSSGKSTASTKAA